MMIQTVFDRAGFLNVSGIPVIAWTAESGATYLLRDLFTTDAAAPLSSPRTCEPGPGTLTIVDPETVLSISSGELTPVKQITQNYVPIVYSGVMARVAGRAFLIRAKQTTAYGSIERFPLLGWTTTVPVSSLNQVYGVLLRTAGTTLNIGGTILSGPAFSLNTYYEMAFVLRSAGVFIVNKETGMLEWVATENGASVAPFISSGNVNTAGAYPYQADNFRVTDLPAPWNTDYGIATQRLAGARSAGDTFSHTANCLVEFAATTLPSADSIIMQFRKQDASNFWAVEVSSTGALTLAETVAGVRTQRQTAAGVVSNGHRVVVIADGIVIRGYSNNVLRWTYSSASNFQTATAGELNSLGTGGAVSDIVAWPRTLSGTALSTLSAV